MDDSAPLLHVDWIRWFQNLATAIQQPLTPGMIPDIPFTKIAMTLSPRLLGRTTAGAGSAEQISVTAPLTLAAGALGLSTPLLAIYGGTGFASYAVGDLLYADTTATLAKLADVSVGSYLRSGGIGIPPLWSTAKLPNTATTGDVLYASAANTYGNLADVAAGSYFRSGGVGTAPLWSTLTLPNSAATGDLLYASGANAMALRTIGSAADVLTVSAGLPVWAPPAAAGTVTIANDTTTNATMFPTWVTASSGNLPIKVSSTKLSFNPSTGTLGVNTATPDLSFVLDVNGGIHAVAAAVVQERFGSQTSHLVRRANGTASVPTIVASGDVVGGVYFQGWDGTAYQNVSSVEGTVDGTPGANDMPGRLTFFTTPDGSTTAAARMLIDNSGRVGIGASPSYHLDVQGSSGTIVIRAGSNVSGDVLYYATGTITGSINMFYSETSATGDVSSKFRNTNTTSASANALFQASVGGASAGDPYVAWLVSGVQDWSAGIDNSDSDKFKLGPVANPSSGGTSSIIGTVGGLYGIGISPTAVLHLKAGTATANTAPLKLTSGTNLTTAEAGAMEYDGTNLFFTRAGTVRENVLVAIDNVAAPTTSIGVAIVNFYGANATNYLGDPNRWLSVNVLGTTYKIPLYT